MRVKGAVTRVDSDPDDNTKDIVRVYGPHGVGVTPAPRGAFSTNDKITVEFDGLRYSDPQHTK